MDDKKWASEVLAKVVDKMEVVIDRNAHKVPYITTDGIYDNRDGDKISWWTNGFWGGVLWEMNILTGDAFYADLEYELEEKMDRNLMSINSLSHDNGFMWLLTSVYHYKRYNNQSSLNRSLLAATNLAGRYNPNGCFIRAWNDNGIDDCRGWAIIDCMMNLPLLYWASEETNDPRFRNIATKHADRVIESFIRPDGSVCHIVEFDPESGARIRSYRGQGYGHGSSWTRGQAWAIYGFVLSYIHTNKKVYLDTAMKVSDYFISSLPDSYITPVDFRQPSDCFLEDTTAASISACGMLEIFKICKERKYYDTAIRMLRALADNRSNWNPVIDNIIEKGTVAYHEGEHERGIIYGDYYFIEAMMKLNEIDFFPW